MFVKWWLTPVWNTETPEEVRFRRGQASQQCGLAPWLFAFVSIHSECVKLIKQPLVLPRRSLGKETASRRATDPTCSQVVCETDGKESTRDNDGERLYPSKWTHQDSVSVGVVYSQCVYYLVTWIGCKNKKTHKCVIYTVKAFIAKLWFKQTGFFFPTIGTIGKSQRR